MSNSTPRLPGVREPLRLADLRHPVWLEDGMKVWVRFSRGMALLCTVQTAAGDAGLIVNASRGFSRVLSLDALFVHHTDVHARPARLPSELL